jgi:hypothetical protein
MLTHYVYSTLALSKTEKRYVTTTDGKMLVWVESPPNFDASKNIQHFVLPRRTTICIDTILFLQMEFTINGR